MAHQDVGDTGVFLARLSAQLKHVVHDVGPAVLLAEVQRRRVLGDGEAVADVVVRHHDEALGVQKLREGLIAQRILRDAVGDLVHADGLALGQPLDGVDGSLSVGGREIKFFAISHSKFDPLVL